MSYLGKKENIDSSDLRHMLKRKIEPAESGRSSNSKQEVEEKEEKRIRRGDKHEDGTRVLARTKSRQTDSARKKHGKNVFYQINYCFPLP